MELFTATHVALVTSVLLSVLRLITCQNQVNTPPTASVTEGDTATIDCLFDRTNLVGLVWLRGNDVVSATPLVRTFRGSKISIPDSDPRFDITSESSLVINGTMQADSGMYWCQVTLQGVFQSSTNLTVSPVITTTPPTTTPPTTKPTTEISATERKVNLLNSVNNDHMRQATASPSVTTTPLKETSTITVKPTKAEPKKQTSNNTTLYIIVGSCAGVVSLAILVLVCYCCCCKKKSPDGYSKANPNTPV